MSNHQGVEIQTTVAVEVLPHIPVGEGVELGRPSSANPVAGRRGP